MAGFQLHLLGPPSFARDGVPVDLGRHKTIALFTYLAVTGHPHRREALATFLWPEYDQAHAAAYLRRSGADPVMVRHLFRTDYETNLVLSRAKASSELFDNGLIVTTIPNPIPNIQATAAQVADSLLRIENVRMSLVIFQLTADTVGISARSTGEINVQVIMESFGGGGHQNVAGAQVQDKSLEEVCQQAVALSKKYIEENDSDESNLTTGY